MLFINYIFYVDWVKINVSYYVINCKWYKGYIEKDKLKMKIR